jgi:hypothetical protein
VKVSVDKKSDRFVCPFANFSDVFAGSGREKASIHYENLAIADDDGGIAALKAVRIVAMFNAVDAVGELGDLTKGLRQHGHGSREKNHGNGDAKARGTIRFERHSDLRKKDVAQSASGDKA